MTGLLDREWLTVNQRELGAGIQRLLHLLERHAAVRLQPETGLAQQELSGPSSAPEDLSDAPRPQTLEQLASAFALSPFESEILLLCASMELNGRVAGACAAAQGDPQRPFPTFSLAMELLPGAHWSALLPAAPLRAWRLIEVGDGETLLTSPLRIDERILHHIVGLWYLDDRLAPLLTKVAPAADLTITHQADADRLGQVLREAQAGARWPVLHLVGATQVDRQAVAAAACQAAGLGLSALSSTAIPSLPAERQTLARLWGRETILLGNALLIEIEAEERPEAQRNLAAFVASLQGPVLLGSRDPLRLPGLEPLRLAVGRPGLAEQQALWSAVLGEADVDLSRLVRQFDLAPQAIRQIGATVLAERPGESLARRLWDRCREQAQARLDDLAQRLEPSAAWADLVLPEAQFQTLREIAAHLRQRARVYDEWGFGGRGARGLGISALFAGGSGTGKTMAAEVLAGVLNLDLYRIDLSSVVSKYIGETEKNLRRVFDVAEEGGAILLFDEADALFGKRSEVKDSHDRYANIEVGYLLQRMEQYRGLAILTTNLKNSLDTAFLRRLRFVVQFPFPDVAQRAEIWRRIFPPATPTVGLDVQRLAQLAVAGGNIRNIAMNAAFLAAEAGEPIQMALVLQAARTECLKIEKPLTPAEIAGWVS